MKKYTINGIKNSIKECEDGITYSKNNIRYAKLCIQEDERRIIKLKKKLKIYLDILKTVA